MAIDLSKSDWWDEFAVYFGFPNDASATISSTTLLTNLQTSVAGHIPQLFTPEFLATQPHYITATPASDGAK